MTSRRGFLGGGLVALAAGLATRRARAAEEQFLLVYWIKGGWDQTYAFDPHFDSDFVDRDPASAPAEVSGIPFADSEDRPAVKAFFTEWGSRTAVLNGIAAGSISHDVGTRLMLSGKADLSTADLPTRLAAACGSSLAVPHAVVAGPSLPGELGGVVTRFDETLLAAARGERPLPRDEARDVRIRAFLDAEAAAASDPAHAEWALAAARLPTLRSFAQEYRGGVASEADRVHLVAALFGAGLSRTAILSGAMPQMAQWDSHVQNRDWQTRCYDLCFSNLAGLCSTLSNTPGPGGGSLLDRTRILVLSEMGRQPTENAQGGKDHWPTTSAMLIGAGVAGGRVYGGTDATLAARGMDRATGEPDDAAARFGPDDLAATIALGFDVDPGELAPGGAPLTAIWA